jgi:hypothetical protein
MVRDPARGSMARATFARAIMNTTLDHLYQLLGEAVLLPIPIGKKSPISQAWQRITFDETQTPEYQKELRVCVDRGGNIGVKLGSGLVAVDIDDDASIPEFIKLNPFLADTLRSRGKRGCQFWFRIKPFTSYPNSQAAYFLKTDKGEKYGEWRCGGGEKGAQSIIFGRTRMAPLIKSWSIKRCSKSILQAFAGPSRRPGMKLHQLNREASSPWRPLRIRTASGAACATSRYRLNARHR